MNTHYYRLYKQASWADFLEKTKKKATDAVVGQALNNKLPEAEYEGPDLWGMAPEGMREGIINNSSEFIPALFNNDKDTKGSGLIQYLGQDQLPSILKDNMGTIKPYINKALYGQLQQQADYDGYDFHGWIPENLQDNFREAVIEYGDKGIVSTIEDRLKERGVEKETIRKVINEGNINQLMKNFVATPEGQKMYPKMVNKYISDKMSSIKDWMGKNKGILAGAVSLPLVFLFAKGLLGRGKQPTRQQPQQRQAHYINPMNRLNT